MSLIFSKECPGSQGLRPPGLVSCFPSEGAGSGARPHLLSVPELCRYLAESWLTFQIHLQELLQYKRQNPAQVICPSSVLVDNSGFLRCGGIEAGEWRRNDVDVSGLEIPEEGTGQLCSLCGSPHRVTL